jgi:hypothetical protein
MFSDWRQKPPVKMDAELEKAVYLNCRTGLVQGRRFAEFGEPIAAEPTSMTKNRMETLRLRMMRQ